MRGFFIILCLAFAQAEKFGYNNHGQSGSNNAIESRLRHRGNTNRTPSTHSPNRNGVKSELNYGHGRYPTDSTQSVNFAHPPETNYNKEFYSYSAPEDDVKDIQAAERLALALPKKLRVVFIKAPENNGVVNAVLQMAQQNAASKTAIYVLTKQPDVADLANRFNNIQDNKESKPEVHFVKYRTSEDAARAQQIIQNEYDALGGGSARVSNEGVAPVLDFSSKGEEQVYNSNVNSNIGSINSFTDSLNAYLPPKSRN